VLCSAGIGDNYVMVERIRASFLLGTRCTIGGDVFFRLPVNGLKAIIASLSTLGLVIDPRPNHVGFVVDKVAAGQIFL
jgi:hypothetical protein